MNTLKNEVAFIDANVADLEQLIAGLRNDVEPIVLHADQGAVEQMARALAHISELSAVHIVAHGHAGEIGFAGGALALENLDQHTDQLRALGLALADDGVVQLYSCNVAEGQRGRQFVKDLAERIGAHVFASAGKVGAAVLGGSWSLSESSGSNAPVPHLPLATDAANSYRHALNITIDLATDFDSGVDNDDGITKLSAVTISGVGGTPANYVQFTIGTTTYSPVLVGFGGVFSFNPPSLLEGTYTIFAQEYNSTLTAPVGTSTSTIITIDQTVVAPSAPDLDATSDSGLSSTDNLTSVTTPTVSGSGAENGATVTLYEGATVRGTAVAGVGGAWSITSSPLSDGNHTLTAKQTDLAGNVSTLSSGFTVTIDSTPPAAGTLAFNNLSDTGNPGDGITQDDTFDLSLTGHEAGAAVAFEVSTNGGSTWSATSAIQSGLPDGAYQFRAKVTDAAGNVAYTTSLVVTVDTAAAAPSAPDLEAPSDSGSSNSDDLTNVTTPTVSGSGAEAGATVTLYDTDGTTALGTAVASALGEWSITSTALAAGSHTLTAKQVDLAGNESAASAALVVTVDTAVAAPSAPDLEAPSDSGSSNSD
ncbi:MAG: Ig-like domain-containing protein, partial [Candidatus Accumulibacter phosphatis]